MTGRPTPEPQLVVDALLDPQHPIKTEIAEWARTHIDPADMIERDRELRFFSEAWSACAARGITGSSVPTSAGGLGNDLVTTALQLEGLGLGCRDNGLTFAIGSQMVSFQEALVRFGSESQQREVLAAACRGELIGAFAMTEEDAGSDTSAIATTASPDGGWWRLSGEKVHVTLAPVANVALVFATTNPDAGRWGLSAFLVHVDRPGVTVSDTRPKMGLRTTPYGTITLDGYRAAADDLVGSLGSGSSIFASCLEVERGISMAVHLGAAERVLQEAVSRANERHQFGRSIGSFQAVSHRLADMAQRHEQARLLLIKAAASVGRGQRATLAATMSKLGVSEAIASIALDAARIHGARGYATEFEVEREVRDALGTVVYGGTSDIQRNLIAALIGVAGASS